jgi:hypothetical protein
MIRAAIIGPEVVAMMVSPIVCILAGNKRLRTPRMIASHELVAIVQSTKGDIVIG